MRNLCAVAAGAVAVLALNTATVRDAQAGCVIQVEYWDVLYIRSGPGKTYPITAAMPPNACGVVLIGNCQGSWCLIRYRPHTGWVNQKFIDWNRP